MPHVRAKHRQTATLREWQQKLRAIYPNKHMSPDYIMTHIYTKCSIIGKEIIRDRRALKLNDAIIGYFAWIMSMCSHFEIEIDEAFVGRFPEMCPYCLFQTCQCDSYGAEYHDAVTKRPPAEQERMEQLEQAYTVLIRSEISLPWFVRTISKIYPSNRTLLKRTGHTYVVAKFLEEGGELHRAYSGFMQKRGHKDAIATEVADLSAWVASCWDLDSEGFDIDGQMALRFRDGCPICKSKPCECPRYAITPGEEELILQIEEGLRALREAKVGDPIEIDKALAETSEARSRGQHVPGESWFRRASDIVIKLQKVSGTAVEVIKTARNIQLALEMLHTMIGS